jgi:hypothetical protein
MSDDRSNLEFQTIWRRVRGELPDNAELSDGAGEKR